MSHRLTVATLNIRNLADRWWERFGLLAPDFGALQPDLLGLQECVYVMHQDRLIGASGEGRYAAIRGWAGRPEYGNSLLVREPLVARDEGRLDLGVSGRAIHRALVKLPAGPTVLVAVTHLHHDPDEPEQRLRQVEQLLPWLDDGPTSDAQVVMGDFNAHPDEPTYGAMVAAGFRSAFCEANGVEPEVTWPTGLEAPMIDDTGSRGCLDYIFVRGAVAVDAARVVFDRPHPEDPGLFPSDHVGLSAQLTIGP